MNEVEVEKARDLILNAQSIVITTHRSPDGDAIGSSLALYHFLKKMGKNAQVIVPNEYPKFISWLEGNDQVLVYEEDSKLAKKFIRESDLIFSLDYNTLSRTFGMQSALEKASADFILIDHHQNPDSYPKVTFSDTSSCSTAQLIYEFIEALGHIDKLDLNMAQGIYLGIVTDSGSFRFDSVIPKTHQIVAHLIELGLDHSSIHRKVYDTNRVDRLKLLGYALSEKLILMTDHKVALISLSIEELERYNFKPGDTEGIVNYALSIDGVEVAIFAREGINQIKISFRSKGGFNVNQFARKHFEGGGHNAAAGGVYYQPMENFLSKIEEVMDDYKNELNEI